MFVVTMVLVLLAIIAGLFVYCATTSVSIDYAHVPLALALGVVALSVLFVLFRFGGPRSWPTGSGKLKSPRA